MLSKIFLFSQKSKAFKYNFLLYCESIVTFPGVPHTQFGPDRFSCFDVYWKQTDRQAKYIYRSQKPN